MKIIDMFGVTRQEGKDIGIEIEMEGENLKYPIRQYWKGTGDGSLRGSSLEYVLKTPVRRELTLQRLKYLKKELEEHGSILQPSDRCGVHIHVNCQQLTVNQVINFAIVYLILEDLLVDMCGEQRVGNLFCLRASDADKIITALRICKQENDLNHIQSSRYRYASINLAAISKFGSVEFRAFQTPKDLLKIQKWIEILLKIKDFSLGFDEAYDIIEGVSFGGPAEFVRNVLGNDANLVNMVDRERLVTEGVRRVQEIAYARTNKKSKKKTGLVFKEADPDAEAPAVPGGINWVVMPDQPPVRAGGGGGELRPGEEDAEGAWRRERERQERLANRQVIQVRPRLRDPDGD